MDKYDMSKVKVSGLGALFTEGVSNDEIQEVEISKLKAFRNHPYRVLDNRDMDELAESIREHGVLEAVICRKSGDGFEIISGHRRKRACELAGMKTVPARIVDVSDDEATVYMVDANLRREIILPSEKAWAYRMKYEAIKHQGKKKADELNKSSLSSMAEETNESSTQIKRYIRLTYLNPELLELVDEEKIPFSVGAVLSFLDSKSQRDLLELLQEDCKAPSGIQAEQLKKLCQQGKMNKEIMRAILTDCYCTMKDTKPVESQKGNDNAAQEKNEGSGIKNQSGFEQNRNGQKEEKYDGEQLQGQMDIDDYPELTPEEKEKEETAHSPAGNEDAELLQQGDEDEDDYDNPDFVKRVMDICARALESEGLEIQNYDTNKGFDVYGDAAHISIEFWDC